MNNNFEKQKKKVFFNNTKFSMISVFVYNFISGNSILR